MNIRTAPYMEQKVTWPVEGRHILAHYDDTSVVVYQAFAPNIGHYAVGHGSFGGAFGLERMSWIKLNFLWMMYRSGWGTKKDQEVTLSVRIRRPFFESVLEQAVPSTFVSNRYTDPTDWKCALATSCVRSQWDPDHSPAGGPLERRAIQLGLRGTVLREYASEAILGVEDISRFVEEQRPNATPERYAHLFTPIERVYVPLRAEAVEQLNHSLFS